MGRAPQGHAVLSRWCRLYLGLVVFSVAGSTLSALTGLQAIWIERLASILLIGSGAAVFLAPLLKAQGVRRVAITGLGVLAIGAASEIVGLYTGWPFGRYAYTAAWWPAVPLPGDHVFPLLLPFAWLMIVGAATMALGGLSRTAAPLAVGLLAATVDLVMEPAMVGPLGYWKWLDSTWPIGGPLPGGAPYLNFVGWTVVSAAGAAWLVSRGADQGGPRIEGVWVLGGHVAFVLILTLVDRLVM